jgi:hypothetical protein
MIPRHVFLVNPKIEGIEDFLSTPYNAAMTTKQVERRPRGRPATGRMPQHQFRCPDDEWAFFERAAASEGVTVAVWLRRVANRAAKRMLKINSR